VRQLHAHAWVEAYLSREQIPDDLIASTSHADFSNGGWLRLDPTPAGTDVNLVIDSVGIWAAAKALFDHVDMLWRNSVLGFNRQRQHRWLYEPLFAQLNDWGWLSGFRMPNWEADTASVWSIVITSMFVYSAILGSVFALILIVLPVPSMVRNWVARRGAWARRQEQSPVDFYRRLESILARRGFYRQPGQTPGELAAAVEQSSRSESERRIGSDAVHAIVAAYYDVRYGGRDISHDQIGELETALGVVRAHLR
jgi:hypothetical protein